MPSTNYYQKVISYLLVLGQQPLIAFKYKVFIKVFQYILKSLESFLIQKCFCSKAKKNKQDKKTGQIPIYQQIL